MDLNKIKAAIEAANKGMEGMAPEAVAAVAQDDNKGASPKKNATDIDLLAVNLAMCMAYMMDMNLKMEYVMAQLGITNEEIMEAVAAVQREAAKMAPAPAEMPVAEAPVAPVPAVPVTSEVK